MKSSFTPYNFQIDPANSLGSYYWLLRFALECHSVLEIGCSTGYFSRHLVEQGSQVTGVEINPLAAEQAKIFCHHVIVGDIESKSTQAQIDRRFDVVILGDILEHLREPGDLLKKIHKDWLAANGRVIISLPNSGHWVFRREVLWGRFPYRRYGLFDRTHLRFFTRSSICSLVTESGYRVERYAFTINGNNFDDFTFAIFSPLYKYSFVRQPLIKLEYFLARILPNLFAYQFVLCLRSSTNK
jgi:SAM-dependent methyltransferase